MSRRRGRAIGIAARVGWGLVVLLAGCGPTVAPAGTTDPRLVLDRAGDFAAADGPLVKLPPAVPGEVDQRADFRRQPGQPGVAVALRCRTPLADEAPRITLVQSSGDDAVDRALLAEPFVRPASEPAGDERCTVATALPRPSN